MYLPLNKGTKNMIHGRNNIINPETFFLLVRSDKNLMRAFYNINGVLAVL